MSSIVVLCEKPNVARRVQEVVKAPNISVVSARGHLIEFGWKGEGEKWTYPVITKPKDLTLRPIEGSADVLATIKNACRDVDTLISATDLDREGSSIFLEIYQYLKEELGPKFNPELKRMVMSSLSKKEIEKAWKDLKPFDWGRSFAGFTRNIQDMEWGINLTRALTLSTNNYLGMLSGGRVQSPMLKMISKRDGEISDFEPEFYYQLTATIESVVDGKAEHYNLMYSGKINDVDKLKSIKDDIHVGDKITLEVVDKDQKTPPPPPFNGTSMQIEGNRAIGLSAKEIADRQKGIAQSLYEKGLISYPGTDSEKYPGDWSKYDYDEFRTLLKGMVSETLSESRAVEGVKEDPAHPCIRPVAKPVENLSDKENKLFDLIVRRCSAGFCKPSVDAVKNVTAMINGHKFTGVGKAEKDPGWRAVYPFNQNKEKTMPDVNDGDKGMVYRISQEQKETKPPAKLNIISLISQCEKHGIGTKNTRPGIIEKLVERGYLTTEKHGKKNVLSIGNEGERIVEVLDKYAGVASGFELTEMFNKAMNDIEKAENGKTTAFNLYEQTNLDMLENLGKVLDNFKKNERTIGMEITGMDFRQPVLCPECGDEMNMRRSKNGDYRFFGCKNYPECKRSLFYDERETIRLSLKCKCGMPIVSGVVTDRYRGKLDYMRCLNDECDTPPISCSACKGHIYFSKRKSDNEQFAKCADCGKFNLFALDFEGVEEVAEEDAGKVADKD